MPRRYYSENIRTLFIEGFSAEELRDLCYDVPVFRPVYDQITNYTGKDEIVRRLLEYAENKSRLGFLLTWAKEHNPVKYEELRPYYIDNGVIPFSPKIFRQWKAAGFSLILMLVVALFFLEPGRSWLEIALRGTPTPTSTVTPTLTLTPTSTPTSLLTPTLPFTREREGEILIIVSSLGKPEGLDFDPQPRIYTGLENAVNQVEGIDIRLEQYNQVINSQEEAETIQTQSAATLVVWGFYDSKGITLRCTACPETTALDSSELQAEDVALAAIGQQAFDLYIGKDISADAALVGLFTLAQALQASQRYDDAVKAYTQAINQALPLPGRSDVLIVAYTQRGVIRDDYLGEPEAAQADYLAATRLEPETKSAIPYRYRGVAHRQLDNFEAAESDLQKAISLDPSYAHPHLDLAVLAYRSQKYTEADRELSLALELSPRLAIAYYYQGILRYVSGDLPGATEVFSRALELDPKLYIVYYFRAIVANDMGNYQQALADLDIAINGLPHSGRPRLIRGIIYTDMGQADLALKDLTSVIERFPDLQTAYFFRGLAYLQLEDFEAAVNDFTQAFKSDIQSSELHFNRGLAYFRLENYEAALYDFDETLREDAQASSAYYFRGLIHETQGDNTLALSDFSHVIELDPANASGYYHRGINYFEKKINLQKAEMDFHKAIRIDPNITLAYFYLGQIAMLKDDLEIAERYFSQVRELLPDYPAIWLGLTDLYLAKDDRGKAQETYQKYKELGGKPMPDYEGLVTPAK